MWKFWEQIFDTPPPFSRYDQPIWKTHRLLCKPLLKYSELGVCRRIQSSHLQAGKHCPVTGTATSDITISAVSQTCIFPALNTSVFFPESQSYRFSLPSAGLVGRLLFKALLFNIHPPLNPVPRQKEDEKRDRASRWHRSPWLDCYFFSAWLNILTWVISIEAASEGTSSRI